TFLPDLIVFDEKKENCYCLDVRITYEGDDDSLRKSCREKTWKYSKIRSAMINFINTRGARLYTCQDIKIYGLVFGSRGAIDNVTLNILRDLGLSNSKIQMLCNDIALSSCMIVQDFARLTGSEYLSP